MVARGSESNNALDVVQDWLVADVYQGTGIGQFYTPNLGINQTNEFVEFSQKVFRDQLAPDGVGSFTGHSLGGGISHCWCDKVWKACDNLCSCESVS